MNENDRSLTRSLKEEASELVGTVYGMYTHCLCLYGVFTHCIRYTH